MGEIPKWALRARGQWRWVGAERPAFAYPARPGQESVWDYPRPPRLVPDDRPVRVRFGGMVIVEARAAWRVLETASPPTVYLPMSSVIEGVLLPSETGSSRCEWKGDAAHWDLVFEGVRLPQVAWSYPKPFAGFEALADQVAFHPARVDCRLGDERVVPQQGGYYGGWVTSEIVGPFKGEPDSGHW